MSNEMDVMNMDERQRHCWLLANRALIPFLAAGWLGLIAWELYLGNVPWLLLAAVPAFALIRLAWYKYYISKYG